MAVLPGHAVRRALAVLLATLPFAGCGAHRDSHPETVPVSGRVTFGGDGVADALVVFYPTTEGTAAAHATTDKNGRFALTSFRSSDGAVPGDYVVLITKQQVLNEMTPEESRAYYARTGTPPPLPTYKDLLPKKYGSHETTDLAVEVRNDQENDYEFVLHTGA